MEKLFITGVDTPIGVNLALALQSRWLVSALGNFAPLGESLPNLNCDLGDAHDIEQRLSAARAHGAAPQWVIHCGEWSRGSWDSDGVDTEPSYAAHVASSLAQACRAQAVRLCVITSDAQFTGPRMFHGEESRATADTSQAETNRAIEAAVQGPGSLIVRAHAYGWSPWGDETSFAQRIWRALHTGQDCFADDNRYATPVLVTDLAEMLDVALTQRWQGVYHLAGIERTNPCRFAAELSAAFQFMGRIVPQSAANSAVVRRWVDETSLNTALARRKLGSPLPMLREGLIRFAAQAEGDWRAQLEELAPELDYPRQRAA